VKAVRLGRPGQGVLRVVLELAPGTRSEVLSQADNRIWRVVATSVVAASVASPIAAAEPASIPTPASTAIRAAHAPAVADRDIVIAIDAGHGGVDPGASGRGGTQEKHVTLAIARALAERVDREPGMRAVLIRKSDAFVPLRERMDRARAARADLFVSIHADAVRDRSVDGASVYILSDRGATSEAARALADRENAADLKGVSLGDVKADLASVLIDLSQSASIGSSVEVADRVLGSLDQVGAVRKKQVQRAGFMVLKSPDTPSMLIETAYISNPAEERKLRSADYQQRLASAIYTGIAEYFRTHPPDGTRYARLRREGAAGTSTLARSRP
jgi:N-acetylmuramoyl-L-alanine amidase